MAPQLRRQMRVRGWTPKPPGRRPVTVAIPMDPSKPLSPEVVDRYRISARARFRERYPQGRVSSIKMISYTEDVPS